MHRDPRGYYSGFGVTPEANSEEITHAYLKKLRRVVSLDPRGSNSKMQYKKLTEAFETLSDFRKRKLYDRHWLNYNTRDGVHYRRSEALG